MTSSIGAPWWREWEFWALAALTAAIYFSRMADLPVRGEETRRAMVAWEILETGDWIVPRQQGEPFLSRPPVGSWPIAWLTRWTGDLSPVAIRLPTILATLLTTLLVYAYSRQFMLRLGALSAGLAFATFAQVLQLGRVAETEATFTLFLAGGLMLWHWGYTNRWPSAATWSIGYAMVAVAALTKSLQAPVYFVGAVGLYLLWRRDWRFLISGAHFVGLCAFVAIFAAWQVPFYNQLGWSAVRDVWASDVGLRFEQLSTAAIVGHFVTYPLQVWACLLPWSFLLPAYVWPQFRRTIGDAMPMVTFAAIVWLVALPTCWLVPNARPRYLMPLYPLAAPLVGLVVQRVQEEEAAAIVRRGWTWFAGGAMAAIVVGAVVVVAAGWIDVEWLRDLDDLVQPAWFALLYTMAAAATVTLLMRGWNRWSTRSAMAAVLLIAGFMGLTYSGVAVNSMIALDPGAERQVAEFRQRFSPENRLGSYGLVETIFSYYWRRPITYLQKELPFFPSQLPPEFEYFCFCGDRDQQVELPFPWRVEAVIDCDRTIDAEPGKVVVIGRRVPAVTLLPDEHYYRR